MKDRNLETLLYTIATLLVGSGIAVRMLGLSENQMGLHLILTGLLVSVAAIMMHMRRINESEQEHNSIKERHYHKH